MGQTPKGKAHVDGALAMGAMGQGFWKEGPSRPPHPLLHRLPSPSPSRLGFEGGPTSAAAPPSILEEGQGCSPLPLYKVEPRGGENTPGPWSLSLLPLSSSRALVHGVEFVTIRTLMRCWLLPSLIG